MARVAYFEGFHVIISFREQGTEDIYNRVNSKEARRTCPEQICRWPKENSISSMRWLPWSHFVFHQAMRWKHWRGLELGSTASELIINSEFVLCGWRKGQTGLK